MPVFGDVQKITDSRFAANDGQTSDISFLT
jgi:hypothetical protein